MRKEKRKEREGKLIAAKNKKKERMESVTKEYK